jgi:hypothetical protein
MTRATGERRIRGGVIMAELGPAELEQFLEVCRRERRTTGFFSGRIISEWLKQHAGKTRHL